MKKQDYLSLREEELLNILWKANRPLTTGEMAQLPEMSDWNNVTLLKAVRTLSDKGYLKITGLEKSVKTYSRKLVPALTKEEYYTGIMMKRGMDISSLTGIVAAFLGTAGKSSKAEDDEVIAELEGIIDTLRKKGEAENGN